MKRLFVTAVLLSAVSAFASPIPNLLGTEIHRHAGANADTTCTDFSGTWKGVCTGLPEHEVQIHQVACAFFISNGQFHAINGVSNQGMVIPSLKQGMSPVYTSNVSSLNWNADKTELTSKISASFKELGGADGSVAASGLLKLVNKQLVSEFSVAGKTYACVYDRK